MKFRLNRASDDKDFGIIEVNNPEELKQLNEKYNNKEDYAWGDNQKIIIDFEVNKEDKEQSIDGIITIYDSYIE